MTQHRVQFDFEVDFSNGGGIQGRRFRLDIEGADITDDALAACLVRDLRLLVVGAVRVFHKQIIAEPHKRVQPPVAPRRLVDLSHELENGRVTYRRLPAARPVCAYATLDDGADSP